MTLSRDARKAETRDALVRAAAKLFANHGIEGTSLDRIATEVGLTKGAVYAHFANKKELVLAVADAYSAESGQQQLSDVLLDPTRPFATRLSEIAEAHWENVSSGVFGLSEVELVLLDLEYFTYVLRDPEMARVVWQGYEESGKALEEIQRKRGEPLTLAGSTVAPLLVNLGRGLTQAHVQAPDLIPVETFREIYASLATLFTGRARGASGASRPRKRGG